MRCENFSSNNMSRRIHRAFFGVVNLLCLLHAVPACQSAFCGKRAFVRSPSSIHASSLSIPSSMHDTGKRDVEDVEGANQPPESQRLRVDSSALEHPRNTATQERPNSDSSEETVVKGEADAMQDSDEEEEGEEEEEEEEEEMVLDEFGRVPGGILPSNPCYPDLNYNVRTFPKFLDSSKEKVVCCCAPQPTNAMQQEFSQLVQSCQLAFNARNTRTGQQYSTGDTFWISSDTEPRMPLEVSDQPDLGEEVNDADAETGKSDLRVSYTRTGAWSPLRAFEVWS
eukprot:765988-Hanusia_phi.AAC.35